MTTTSPATTDTDVQAKRDTIYTDGIVGVPGAFSTEWADQLREDIEAAYAEARTRDRGAIGRGPNRWYVEVHPEQIRGFLELVSHPTVTGVCEAVLGPDYEIVEIGFDIPFPSQSYGTVPDPAWKQKKYNQDWQIYDTVNATIGQGYMLINPLQMAVMAVRVRNKPWRKMTARPSIGASLSRSRILSNSLRQTSKVPEARRWLAPSSRR